MNPGPHNTHTHHGLVAGLLDHKGMHNLDNLDDRAGHGDLAVGIAAGLCTERERGTALSGRIM